MKPDLSPRSPERDYRGHLKAGRFCLQRCVACSHALAYPRASCPLCGSMQLDFIEASGRGVVHSTTVVHRPAAAGGDYNVALIELAEGPRVLSRVEGIAPHRAAIGMQVVAIVRSVGVEPLLVFEPASDVGR